MLERPPGGTTIRRPAGRIGVSSVVGAPVGLKKWEGGGFKHKLYRAAFYKRVTFLDSEKVKFKIRQVEKGKRKQKKLTQLRLRGWCGSRQMMSRTK